MKKQTSTIHYMTILPECRQRQ